MLRLSLFVTAGLLASCAVAHPNSVVDLNVGGTRYTTKMDTLRNAEGSMLAAMFKAASPSLDKDSKGAYFIDRDGAAFRHILNYLRDAHLPIQHLNDEEREAVLREARYYNLEQLVLELSASTSEKGGSEYTTAFGTYTTAGGGPEDQPVAFNAKVQKMIDQGWRAQGGLSSEQRENAIFLAQAMVRENFAPRSRVEVVDFSGAAKAKK
jgi:hypothetical protein